MGELQRSFRARLEGVLELKAQRRVKVMLLQSLLQEMRELQQMQDQMGGGEQVKWRSSCEVLSTAVSECPSVGYQGEKEVEELEERIISLRMVKFEQNEHI
jgi:hypothetical protein